MSASARPEGWGLFLTLEGIDGSGKSTQASLLAEHLRVQGFEVVSLREPGGTALGERIRSVLLDPASAPMAPECELLLYEASRAQLVRQVVEPALARGAMVVCDRFADSTVAYQAGGRGLDEHLVSLCNQVGCVGMAPDATFLLDLDPAQALARAASEAPDRIEAEGLGLQRRVRARYLRLAHEEPGRVHVIDAIGPVEEVWGRLSLALTNVLGQASGVHDAS